MQPFTGFNRILIGCFSFINYRFLWACQHPELAHRIRQDQLTSGWCKIDRIRQQSMIYLVLAILGMGFLAASLSDLKFEPGLPIPGSVEQTHRSSAKQTSPAIYEGVFPWLFQSLLGIALVLLLFVFLAALLKKASRKRIGLTAAGLALLVVLFLIIPRITSPPPSLPEEPLAPTPAAFDYVIAPVGDPPGMLIWMIMAGLAMIAAGLGVWLLVMANRQSVKEDLLAREAAAAIQAIAEGQDIKNVIIRCYLQMERVIQQERGIERKEAVTPREFERHLAARGIPNPPVRQLTRLFETARYGNQFLGPQVEQEAVDCLTAIRAACLPVKGGNE